MYSVLNENGQLKLSYSSYVEYYEFQTFKSVSSALDTLTGKYYVSINFIANDKNNALRLYLPDINNQASWTNDAVGAQNAVEDISLWISSAVIPAAGAIKSSIMRRASLAAASVSDEVYSISFASVGTANALVSADSGASFVTLKPGEAVSFDAGDINNKFPSNNFEYDVLAANAELLIIYVY